MRVSLTTASNDPFSANFKQLPHGDLGGIGAGAAQCVRIAVAAEQSPGGDGALWLALRDDKNCFVMKSVTIAALASARAQAGGTGNYLMTVTVESSDILDLLGSGCKHGELPNGRLRWFVGIQTMPSGVTTLQVDSFVSHVI